MNYINPFPGLRSFDISESHLFFGREKHINELLNKLEQNHFVAIVGTSGSGKSSLVRAGLLPALNNKQINIGTGNWLIAQMKPGNTPVKNLCNALMKSNVFATGSETSNAELSVKIENLLRASSLGLVQTVRNQLKPGEKLLILLDQFEEAFRYHEGSEKNEAESLTFINLIIDAIRQRDVPIYAVLTVRSDFLGDCARFEGLPEAINDGHYLVPRLNAEQNKLAITGPVQYASGKISPRLVQMVLNDLGDNPDQLPVLQHALMRTWDKWVELAEPGEPMDVRHYQMIGTMHHALSNHADEAFNELKTERQKELIENIFKCLTVRTGENRGVRRPTSLKHLCEICEASADEVSEVLHPFRKHGRTFILPSEEVKLNENTVLDISHESLMRAWERLNVWVNEESESTIIYERLCESALLHKEGKAALWRDPELQVALDWQQKNKPNKAWAAQYNQQFETGMLFLKQSDDERTAERRGAKRRRLIVRSAVTTFLVVVSLLTAWALLQTKKANEQTLEAQNQTKEAINQKQQAEKAKEMALAASQQAMDAKSFAELQSQIATEQSKLAQEQKLKAEQEAQNALNQENNALQQKKLADQKSTEAQMEKLKADSAQNEANRLHLLALSQSISFKSMQVQNDNQLCALLAYESYLLAKNNGGNTNDQQIFSSVYNAAPKISSSFKDTRVKETSAIKASNSNGISVYNLLGNGTVTVYDCNDLSKQNTITLTGAAAVLNTAYISNDCHYALIGANDNSALVYNLKTSSSTATTLTGHKGLIRAAAFSNDGTVIATGGRDSAVYVYQNFKSANHFAFAARIKSLAFAGDNNNLLVGCENGTVYLLNISSGTKNIYTSLSGNRVQNISCSTNGKIVAVAYSSGAVQILKNQSLIKSINESSSADYVDIDELHDAVVVVTSKPVIHVYQLSNLSAKPIEINTLNSLVNGMSLGSQYVFVGCADNSLRTYPYHTSFFENIFAQNLSRNLTTEEWNQYLGSDVPYQKTISTLK